MMSEGKIFLATILVFLHLATTSATATGSSSGLSGSSSGLGSASGSSTGLSTDDYDDYAINETEQGGVGTSWPPLFYYGSRCVTGGFDVKTGDLWENNEGKACYCYDGRVHCMEKGRKELRGDIWKRRDGKYCYYYYSRVHCLEKGPRCFHDYTVSTFWSDEYQNFCSTRCPLLGISGGVICMCRLGFTWWNEQGEVCTCHNGRASCTEGYLSLEQWNHWNEWRTTCGASCGQGRENRSIYCNDPLWQTYYEKYCFSIRQTDDCIQRACPVHGPTRCADVDSWFIAPGEFCTCEGFDAEGRLIRGCVGSVNLGAGNFAPMIPAHLNECKYPEDGVLKYAEYNKGCNKCENCEKCNVFNERTCSCRRRPFCKP